MPDFGKLNFSVSFNPTSGFPLDARYTFDSLTAAQEAAASAVPIGSSDGVYFYGENVVVVEDEVATLYLIQPDGTLSALGASEDISQLTSQVTQIQENLTTLGSTVDGKEDITNKVTSLSASSTDTQYPSAKVVYDQLALRLTDAPSDGKQYARSDGDWSEVVITTPDLQAVLNEGGTASTGNIELTGASAFLAVGSTDVAKVGVGSFSLLHDSAPIFTAAVSDTGELEVTGADGSNGIFNDWLQNDVTGNTATLDGTVLTKAHVGLSNVTNESKATMFTNPTFTGTVTVPTPTAATAAANKQYVDDAIGDIPDPTLNDVVTAGNTITSGTLTTTLSAGALSFNDTDSSNSFSINVATPAVAGSDEMKSVFTEWLGVGLVYRYSAA